MDSTFKNLLDNLDALPQGSPIIPQMDKLLAVLISIDEDTAKHLVKIAEGLASGSYVIVKDRTMPL